MNRFFGRVGALSLIVALSSLITVNTFAGSTPTEAKSIVLKRSVSTANPAVVSLSKNLFKTESYEAPYNVEVPYETTEEYTVQIPYEATESYTIQVPYQDTETYTIQVPYQDTETYTENVPYQVSVPYTDYETDYRNEQQCRSVTRYRNECRNEQQCYLVPGDSGGGCRDVQECGTNALGQQICKTRQVCSGGSGQQQRCENRQVCNNVPYNDQECSMVQVPYRREVTRYRNETQYRRETRTRTVTRHRSETRTRTVTKHRTESRTRTVTKHRTETRTRPVTKTRTEERCCVTKTRQVFDQQLQFQVSVHFPEGAVLSGKETESITITLVDDKGTVSVQASNAVYGYKIANQSVSGASVVIELALAPKYDESNAGASTIKSVLVDFSTTYSKHRIAFTDSFKAAKVESSYVIVITDALTGNLVEEIAANKLDSSGKSVTRIATALNKKTKIIATLKVKRVSSNIANGALEFTVEGKN